MERVTRVLAVTALDVCRRAPEELALSTAPGAPAPPRGATA